jgi:small nuclear ribonucleoprotein (snRNP)-like protein
VLINIDNVREYRDVLEKYEKLMYIQLSDLKNLLKENNIQFLTNTINCFLPNLSEGLHGLSNIGTGVLKVGPAIEKKVSGKKSLIRANPISYILSARTENIV